MQINQPKGIKRKTREHKLQDGVNGCVTAKWCKTRPQEYLVGCYIYFFFQRKFQTSEMGWVFLQNTRNAVLFITNYLTPWSRVPSERLTGPQLFKKFPNFNRTRASLLHSQQPTNSPSWATLIWLQYCSSCAHVHCSNVCSRLSSGITECFKLSFLSNTVNISSM